MLSFQKALKAYGVPDEEVFQTPDLFEGRNIPQVVKKTCLTSYINIHTNPNLEGFSHVKTSFHR